MIPKKKGSVWLDLWKGVPRCVGRFGYRLDDSRVRFSSGLESMNLEAHIDRVAWPCNFVTNTPSGSRI